MARYRPRVVLVFSLGTLCFFLLILWSHISSLNMVGSNGPAKTSAAAAAAAAKFTTVESGRRQVATLKFCNIGASIAAYTLHPLSSSSSAGANGHGVKDGNKKSVAVELVTGFERAESYAAAENPFFGATVGRVANRIKGGILKTNHGEYPLAKNEGDNTLHGGWQTYHTRVFDGPTITSSSSSSKSGSEGVEDGTVTTVEYTLLDEHDDAGFPGTVRVTVRYHVSEIDGEEGKGGRGGVRLEVEYEARLEGDEAEETAINLANHSYFTVSGGADIGGTEILLASNEIVEVDDALIPTGKFVTYPIIPVNKSSGAIEPLSLGSDTKDGFADHCFILRRDCGLDTRADAMQRFATFSHAGSGVTLRASTTEPAFQFYTGDGTNTSNVKGESKVFGKRAGLCLEAQRYIDATSNDAWKAQVLLKRGQVYGSRTRYEAFRRS